MSASCQRCGHDYDDHRGNGGDCAHVTHTEERIVGDIVIECGATGNTERAVTPRTPSSWPQLCISPKLSPMTSISTAG